MWSHTIKIITPDMSPFILFLFSFKFCGCVRMFMSFLMACFADSFRLMAQ